MAHFWLRAETKPFEKRRALSPGHVKELLERGHQVTVEESGQSIFPLNEYTQYDCAVADEDSWPMAPQDAIILGLKELPDRNDDLIHTHIFFAHCFKQQTGWKEILNRFNRGGGKLYDLEFLTNEKKRRVAAFGYWAGYAGAAYSWALWQYYKTNHTLDGFTLPHDFACVDDMHQYFSENFAGENLEALVIGAQGRSGKGATDFFQRQGCMSTGWDRTETSQGGPFKEILNFDIFINCVLMMSKNPPFLDLETVKANERLSIIGDVSCDPTGPFNSLPIYSDATTFDQPVEKVKTSPSDLYVMAIDHLPSLLPKESSEDFANQLFPHLLEMESDVWKRALDLFDHHRHLASQ
jgi:saccharopine dehydrogenase (NAD+, L-lysine-forming)